MNPTRNVLAIGLLAAGASLAFVLVLPIPLPFPGATFAFGAGLACLATLAVISWMPPRWVWSEAEILAYAFRAHHGITATGADRALSAITDAHARADVLRSAAPTFQPALTEATEQAADRLDASAREIFYDPNRLFALRTILTRSELIEEATLAHKTLVTAQRSGTETQVKLSRETLLSALAALEDAFLASDLAAAKGVLEEVQVASSVAERLLSPRRPATLSQTSKDGQTP